MPSMLLVLCLTGQIPPIHFVCNSIKIILDRIMSVSYTLNNSQ